jgi:hypothetical protein
MSEPDPLCIAWDIRRPWPVTIDLGHGPQKHYPSMVTIWHREPRGVDAGTICRHWHDYVNEDGWQQERLSNWRYHFWHWKKIQLRPLQALCGRVREMGRCLTVRLRGRSHHHGPCPDPHPPVAASQVARSAARDRLGRSSLPATMPSVIVALASDNLPEASCPTVSAACPAVSRSACMT